MPEGFRVIGFDEGFDVRKYNRVLWYGFNHGLAAPAEDDEMLQFRINCVSSPHSNRYLMTAVVAPNGEFVKSIFLYLDKHGIIDVIFGLYWYYCAAKY